MNARCLTVVAALCLAAPAAAQVPAVVEPENCRPAADTTSAVTWLMRARTALGMPRLRGRIPHLRGIEAEEQDYESDRTYRPYFSSFQTVDGWLDPANGTQRYSSRITFPGIDGAARPTILANERAAFVLRDTVLAPAAAVLSLALTERGLDPWAVVTDWSGDSASRVQGRCRYRDYDRVVLTRQGPYGTERLFLSRNALPIKLDRTEPHYLWGQQHVEYVYSTWVLADSVAYPGSSIRLVDGGTNVTRTVGKYELISRDSAPALAIPASAPMTVLLPGFLQAIPPDTARVAPGVFVLRNRGYGETVTLVRDTVFIFDATQSDDRARQDSTWIAKLFPGHHPIVLVVTDLAWPHVSGVRFWVASGATVVSHRASRVFLEQIVAHHWTVKPDKLELQRKRGPVTLRFRPVSDSLRLAGGEIGIYAIDGVGSEGALMAYVRNAHFLWASDFIQSTTDPTLYAYEVWRAARRSGLDPQWVSAEHVPVTPWGTIDHLVSGVDVEGPGR